MNYEEFKAHVMEGIKDYLPDEYKEAEICIREVNKNNDTRYEGLCLKMGNISPSINLNKLYEKMIAKNLKISDILTEVREVLANAFSTQSEIASVSDSFSDYNEMKDHLYFTVVNSEKNKEILKSAAHEDLEELGLSKICRCRVNDSGSFLVTTNILEIWGVTEDEVIKQAELNTPVIMNSNLCSMADFLRKTIFNQYLEMNIPADVANIMADRDISEYPKAMYILSNKEQMYGATLLAIPGKLAAVAEELNDDMYVIPSSVHELLCLPKSAFLEEGDAAKNLPEIIHSVNCTAVDNEDYLSDNLFFYNRETDEISIIA